MKTLNRIHALVFAFALTASVASAQCLINFETIPGGVPSDGLAISNQFQASHGVTFSLAGGGTPVLAERGLPETAFEGFGALADEPAPGTSTGQYFLTDDGSLTGAPDDLIISYTLPVSAARGRILDVDHSEQFTVEARDVTGKLIDTRVLNPSATDGDASPWVFSYPVPVIKTVRIRFTGTPFQPTNVVGFAIDNLNCDDPALNVGQANSALAALVVNGVGQTAAVAGPHGVMVTDGKVTFNWSGPANMPLVLVTGPLNPANQVVACVGSIDLGTPTMYNDLVAIMDGTAFPGSLLYTLNASGNAQQTFTLPSVPPGILANVQGFVFQPGAIPCVAVATAAFQIATM